jgi:hypothetical protein
MIGVAAQNHIWVNWKRHVNAITGLAIWYFGGHPPTPLADGVFRADIVCNSNTYQDRQKKLRFDL